MKVVKISSKLVKKFNEFESFMSENFVRAVDDDGEIYFACAVPERASMLRPKFEKLCTDYHRLIEVEAKSNGVVVNVIEHYFNSKSPRKKGLFNWEEYIKDYLFEVEEI